MPVNRTRIRRSRSRQAEIPPGYMRLDEEAFVRRLTEHRDPHEAWLWQALARIPAVRWGQGDALTRYVPLTRW